MSNKSNLLLSFLEQAKHFDPHLQHVEVLRSNTYRINDANILIRCATDLGRRYFFGLNYINAEEIYNLDNSFIAFICGSLDKILFLPADVFMQYLPDISHDRNGEYKINIDRNLNLILRGRGNSIDCSIYLNNWDSVLKIKSPKAISNTPDESFHNVLQGRLIEIGNIRGYMTYCPNKAKNFNRKKLEEIIKIQQCPQLQFTDFQSLRNIDVLWFRALSNGFYPEYAFEVELSTGVWSGFGRLATLREYNTRLYIVSANDKKFSQVSGTFPEIKPRCVNIQPEKIGLLYSAEKNLITLREEFNL
jgi:hypothetical protein